MNFFLKHDLFEGPEVDNLKKSKNQRNRHVRDSAQINAFQYKFFSKPTVSDTVAIPQTNFNPCFREKSL